MSSIMAAVFKATIGLLFNKGRDKVAEKLKDGDVTDQKFRSLIVREIDDIKSKLDGLARKDVLASISFFKEGIEFLYEVFDKASSRSEYGAETAAAFIRTEEKNFEVGLSSSTTENFSLIKGIGMLELPALNDSAIRTLTNAKERFKDARRKATEAFNNEALEPSDRILAMQYRITASILETVDNPADSLPACRVCIEELHSLPAVQNSFKVELDEGVRGWFSKDERMDIISTVCHVNRVVHDVTQTVAKDVNLWIWPCVDTGEEKIDPLRDSRVAKTLRKVNVGHCCATTWSFGQDGELEHKLETLRGISTNSKGQFIIGDNGNRNVKVFDSSGNFMYSFPLPDDDVGTTLSIYDVATDKSDNTYVLVRLMNPGAQQDVCIGVCVFTNTADLLQRFLLRRGWYWSLAINNNNQLLVVADTLVDTYETDGQLVRSFGKETLKTAIAVACFNDNRVIVADQADSLLHVFSEEGEHLFKFKMDKSYKCLKMAIHQASQHVIVACKNENKYGLMIYTKDGEFTRCIQLDGNVIEYLRWVAVTREGRIAIAFRDAIYQVKTLVV